MPRRASKPAPTRTSARGKPAKPKNTQPANPQHSSQPRMNIDVQLPDFEEWQRNLSSFATANPAAVVTGALAVLLALLLLFP